MKRDHVEHVDLVLSVIGRPLTLAEGLLYLTLYGTIRISSPGPPPELLSTDGERVSPSTVPVHLQGSNTVSIRMYTLLQAQQ